MLYASWTPIVEVGGEEESLLETSDGKQGTADDGSRRLTPWTVTGELWQMTYQAGNQGPWPRASHENRVLKD